MIVRKEEEFHRGYTPITELHGRHAEMLLDFGILKMQKGDVVTSSDNLERAWLLIKGDVGFCWEGHEARASRFSCFDENPEVLHVSAQVEVTITAYAESEMCVERTENGQHFSSQFYDKKSIKSDVFGQGVLDGMAVRTVRTVFDGQINPQSNMVLGEVINHPGKWSSYPPHDHPHPEIYHYRFFPRQGFGISLLDENPYLVKDGDTSLIFPNTTHSQVAGAGYAMYYIWMIAHLPNDKWLPTTRYYRKEHAWMLEPNVPIWPRRTYDEE